MDTKYLTQQTKLTYLNIDNFSKLREVIIQVGDGVLSNRHFFQFQTAIGGIFAWSQTVVIKLQMNQNIVKMSTKNSFVFCSPFSCTSLQCAWLRPPSPDAKLAYPPGRNCGEEPPLGGRMVAREQNLQEVRLLEV